jgi:squalene-hopene/tetraprenyl-beta-curcumene cyclase
MHRSACVGPRWVVLGLTAVLAMVGCSRPQPPEPAKEAAVKPVAKAVSAGEAIDRGLAYLRGKQEADGAYRLAQANLPIDVGMTGLVVEAMACSPRNYREADGPFVSKAVAFLLAHQEADGGIRGEMLGTYTTAIGVVALESLKNPKYKDNISRAVGYLKNQQCIEANGYNAKEHSAYGGFGYGSTMRPDVSNTQMALDAFQSAGLAKDDPAYRQVVVFLSRCQNNSETNDQAYAGTDGGGLYSPVESKAGEYTKPDGTKGLRSYGSMTYALLKSMIYANLTKDDPRVTAAVGWIKKNYTLDENPGLDKQGLYYYYHTFAKSMTAYGQAVITDDKGVQHEWRKELIAKLASLQRPDGSWANDADRWYENDPVLVTCYAILALEEASRKP